MENNMEQTKFRIEVPKEGDEIDLAPMHIQAWKESYITPESGLSEEMIDDMIGHLAKNTEFRRNTIAESLSHPDIVLYRVVRNSKDEIVGFFHASKNDTYNELDGIYLLNEVKGSGIAGKLMEEFLAWIDKTKPCFLEVFSFNQKAISFYNKYGFEKTNTPAQLYKDKLPYIEMIRPAKVQ